MSTLTSVYRYWGKAKPKDASIKQKYHLLPYHCLDVAAIGWHLFSPNKPLAQRLAAQLDVDIIWLQRWFCFCLVLHDLGKFASAFQALVLGLSNDLIMPCEKRRHYHLRHDSLGFILWQDVFEQRWQEYVGAHHHELKIINIWLQCVFGHHGKPPSKNNGTMNAQAINYFSQTDIESAWQLVLLAADLFDIKTLPMAWVDKTFRNKLKIMTWQIAGYAVIADWLGSNTDYFPYQNKPMVLEQYWHNKALIQAEQALIHAGMMQNSTITSYTHIAALFEAIQSPTPLQQWAETIAIEQPGQLFILEDVTGAGKTEAALVLTHRLMTSGAADGMYFGLPTMATSNAMYQRLGHVYKRFYEKTCQPSLVLAHSARHLTDNFTDTIVLSQQIEDNNYQCDELTASAQCNAWIADSHKRALLAEIGVGTLDQVLLGVLPAKHQSLRLVGLARKILIVDEVHAYDEYMTTLLEAVLKFHAVQGGSAILLSATMPYQLRSRLMRAWCAGKNTVMATYQPQHMPPFPFATQLNETRLVEQALTTRSSVKRRVSVKFLEEEQQAKSLLLSATKRGGCACWIRNTVDDAIRAYQDLISQGVPPEKIILFHSRFTMLDRQKLECKVLDSFGANSKASDRAGKILVATQVVEQSLDLDFDVMVSDLAPIDLLIQRMGRLQRHCRDALGNRLLSLEAEDQRTPLLYVFAPSWTEQPDVNWVKSVLPGTNAIYELPQLWLTMKILLTKGYIHMPDDARELIEAVYGEVELPAALDKKQLELMGKQMAAVTSARLRCLDFTQGYVLNSGANGIWADPSQVLTRLSEVETKRIALVRIMNGQLTPWHGENVGSRHVWDMSMVTVSKRIADELPTFDTGLKREQLPQALRYVDKIWAQEQQPCAYHYDSHFGVYKKPHEGGERCDQ